ncbi:MAG: glutaredoxin [Halioglobus sp.]|nr:glutaredoxin [Halioglobus sp.]
MAVARQAVLYRMDSTDHLCPFGLKSRDLLRRKGFSVDDRTLESREQVEHIKKEFDVKTTPQVIIDGRRIGGYEELRTYFGLQSPDSDGDDYRPVIAIFATSLLVAVAIALRSASGISLLPLLTDFIAVSMCVLAIQKLRDLEAFTNQFITYDLLSMRDVRYAYVYPFAEAYAGLAMLAGWSAWVVAPVALFIGIEGAVSVTKAVYLDHRELKCACVGGNSNVPLGAISLTENLFMVVAAALMWLQVQA